VAAAQSAARPPSAPLALNTYQNPDMGHKISVNSNFGADIGVQSATMTS
jgi:hypothetical protein